MCHVSGYLPKEFAEPVPNSGWCRVAVYNNENTMRICCLDQPSQISLLQWEHTGKQSSLLPAAQNKVEYTLVSEIGLSSNITSVHFSQRALQELAKAHSFCQPSSETSYREIPIQSSMQAALKKATVTCNSNPKITVQNPTPSTTIIMFHSSSCS